MQEISLNDYKHCIEVPVRFMDIDALQHVNNARYLNFLEESRIAYSQELLDVFNSIQELNVLVARVEIDFLRPVLFGEKLQVYTRISKLGTKSFTFESVITTANKKGEFPAAKAVQTLVAFDPKTHKSAAIAPELRERIIELEPNLEKK
jgi:acyl-CoA thioester hydrolase